MPSSEIVWGGSAGAVVATVAYFLFRSSISAWLKRDVEVQVESHKHELQKQRDLLAHDLEQQMLKVQLQTQGIHRVYPELYKRLKEAEADLAAYIGGHRNPSECQTPPLFISANDFRIENELYISESVNRVAGNIFRRLRDSHHRTMKPVPDRLKDFESADKDLEVAGELLTELRTLMKREMLPDDE